MTPAVCCAHRGLDHVHREGVPVAGSRCTFPDCPCKGWIPRSTTSGKRPSEVPAKIQALHKEGLSTADICERLGVSASRVASALRGVRRAQVPRSRRRTPSRRGKRAAVSECIPGWGL